MKHTTLHLGEPGEPTLCGRIVEARRTTTMATFRQSGKDALGSGYQLCRSCLRVH